MGGSRSRSDLRSNSIDRLPDFVCEVPPFRVVPPVCVCLRVCFPLIQVCVVFLAPYLLMSDVCDIVLMHELVKEMILVRIGL